MIAHLFRSPLSLVLSTLRFSALSSALFLSLTLPLGVQAELRYRENGTYSYTVLGADSGILGALEIPSTYNGKPITSIATGAFQGRQDITSVTIDSNDVYMGEWAWLGNQYLFQGNAFNSCTNITSITLRGRIQIVGSATFYGCTGLTNLTVEGSIASIGRNAFGSCTALANITLGDQIGGIENDVFNGCSSLTHVSIPKSLTTIGNDVFSGSGIVSVTIPEGVTSIGTSAFANCLRLRSVTIPATVTSIQPGAFLGCQKLMSFYFLGDCYDPGFDSLGGGVGSTLYYLPGKLNWKYPANAQHPRVEWTAGASSPTLTYVVREGGVTITGSSPQASGALILPATINGFPVTSIATEAFADFRNLTSVSIPNSVTNIGNGAFLNCVGLTSMVIPDSVTTVGDQAFSSCLGLTRVTIGKNVTSIGDQAFFSCAKLANVVIPNSVTRIGDHAFWNCKGLGSVTIGSGVKALGRLTFLGCSELRQVCFLAIPPSGFQLFEECNPLLTVYYVQGQAGWKETFSGRPTAVTKPVAYTSNGMSITITGSLPEPTGAWVIPSTIDGLPVTAIANGAFYGCTALTSVTIPNSVTTIGSWAFQDCRNLTSVIFGNSVTAIGDYAFYGCAGLEQTYFLGSQPILGSGVFNRVEKVLHHYIEGKSGWGNSFDGRPTATWIPPNPPETDMLVLEVSKTVNNPLWIPVAVESISSTESRRFYRLRGSVLEVTSNLAAPVWVPMATITAVIDPQRFYRLRAL